MLYTGTDKHNKRNDDNLKKTHCHVIIHHFDEPPTPGTGTSFRVTDLLLRM